jgi:hypothetical protein
LRPLLHVIFLIIWKPPSPGYGLEEAKLNKADTVRHLDTKHMTAVAASTKELKRLTTPKLDFWR